MLQDNLLAEILDSHKRYSLEVPDGGKLNGKRIRNRNNNKIGTDNVMTVSVLSYDADVAFLISVPRVS